MDHYIPAPPPYPPIEPGPLPSAPPLRPPRGYPALAWFFIVLACAIAVGLSALDLRGSRDAQGEDRVGAILMEIQGKYMLGAASVQDASLIYHTAERSLNTGSLAQRHRFIVLAAELMGKDEAATKLRELDEQLAQAQEKRGADVSIMTPEEIYVHAMLHELYLPDEGHSVESISEEDRKALAEKGILVRDGGGIDRDVLVRQLGWYGELALASADSGDPAARGKIISQSKTFMYVVLAGVVVGAGAGVLGFAGLITLAVFLFMGKLRSGLNATNVHHGIYAETFAIWMFLFFLFQIGAGMVGEVVPFLALLSVFVSMFLSLSALLWPIWRGVSWSQVKRDIGWKVDRPAALEPVIGAAGYLMALPILVVGVTITYILLLIQQAFKAPGPMFEPAGGPSHPIIEQLAGPDWFPKFMVLALAAIAAPIVEETMFRGVLYRHLRDGLSQLGLAASIILATLINSFVFALIHPQGWVAIPALMSLAIAFSLMREWRGSIIPPMVMHGISNFLVMSLLILALSM